VNRGSRRGRRNVRPDARPFPRLATLHRWLGVGLGVWFALVGFSGALLVWRDEVDAWLNPQLFGLKSGTRSSGTSAGTAVAGSSNGPAATAAQPLDIERVLDLAHGELALGRVDRIHLPAAPGEPWRLQVRASRSRVESGRIEAFIDSQSGDLLGRRRLEGFSLAPEHAMRTLYEFHRNILLGEPGSDVVGLAGLLLLGSTVTGSVLAWPRTRGRLLRLLSVSWRANATRLLFDLHRVGGVLIALVLLLTTLTGATLVYLNYVRDIVDRLSRVDPIPVLPFRATPAGAEPLPMSELAARAERLFPGQRIAEIHLSERGLTGVLFQLRGSGDVHRLGDTIAWLHPISGELLAERSSRTRSAGEAFMHWLLPLHVGSAFGTPGLVLMCAAGLAPMLLVSTGLWVWWRKRPGEKIARDRAVERAAARSAQRSTEAARRRADAD